MKTQKMKYSILHVEWSSSRELNLFELGRLLRVNVIVGWHPHIWEKLGWFEQNKHELFVLPKNLW